MALCQFSPEYFSFTPTIIPPVFKHIRDPSTKTIRSSQLRAKLINTISKYKEMKQGILLMLEIFRRI